MAIVENSKVEVKALPKDKNHYAKLFGAYITFYLFMSAWMALHLGVMVGEMPAFGDTGKLCSFSDDPCRAPIYAGGGRTETEISALWSTAGLTAPASAVTFITRHMSVVTDTMNTLGEPRYNGFYSRSFTVQNEGSGTQLKSDPWSENEKFATSNGVSSSACGTVGTDGVSTNSSSFSACTTTAMFRTNNAWDLRVAEDDITVTCNFVQTQTGTQNTTTSLRVVAAGNPWDFGPIVAASGNAGSPNAVRYDNRERPAAFVEITPANNKDFVAENTFTWVWKRGAVFPLMMQYMVMPAANVPAGDTISFNAACSASSAYHFEEPDAATKMSLSFSTPSA